VDWYEPGMGCGWVKTGASGLERCWFIGPENETKDELEPGDVDRSGATFHPVDNPDEACCRCCDCGVENADPIGCFDTPAGGCVCCPEFGVDDDSEWVWTWSDSTRLERAFIGRPLRTVSQGHAFGNLRYRNGPGAICDRVLSVSAAFDNAVWFYDGQQYYLECSVSELMGQCSQLEDWFDGVDGRWLPPCGNRLMVPQLGTSLWPIPRPSSLSGLCRNRSFAHASGVVQFGVRWDDTRFTGVGGCQWAGSSGSGGQSGPWEVDGGIAFSGSCHSSRVEWDYVYRRWDAGTDELLEQLTTSGYLDYQLAKAPCPGGCGQRARFFGVGAVPPAGMMLVPKSLGGLL
jgi:hypothetical protein